MTRGGISIHVVDVTRARAAAGMRVEVHALEGTPRLVGSGVAGPRGLVDVAAFAERFQPGRYEVRFHVAEYFRAAGQALPARPFLDVVCYRFGIDDPDQHYHLPFKTTPWGYSCFRGA